MSDREIQLQREAAALAVAIIAMLDRQRFLAELGEQRRQQRKEARRRKAQHGAKPGEAAA